MGSFDISTLEARCHTLLVHGLASSTRNSYASGQKKFYDFCTQLGKIHPSGSPCPADEWTLCLFATFLANTVQYSTIKVYLSAVRSLHVDQGFSDPLVNCLRLQRVLRGIKRTQGDFLLNGFQSQMRSWLLSSKHWTSRWRIIACFGQPVAWRTLAFFALRNSPSPIWPVTLLPSIWVWPISLWTLVHCPRAFALG